MNCPSGRDKQNCYESYHKADMNKTNDTRSKFEQMVKQKCYFNDFVKLDLRYQQYLVSGILTSLMNLY